VLGPKSYRTKPPLCTFNEVRPLAFRSDLIGPGQTDVVILALGDLPRINQNLSWHRSSFGHESLDVTLAYLKGKGAESKETQEHANSSSLALYA
jgi:hypothetical protein